jgi:hypothetical protein
MSLILMSWDDFAPLPPILGENKIQSPPELGDLVLFFNPSKLMTQTSSLYNKLGCARPNLRTFH